jgi:hypothetical protein
VPVPEKNPEGVGARYSAVASDQHLRGLITRSESGRIPAERATLSCHETICGFWSQIQWLTSQGGPDQTLELPTGSCTITASDTGVSWLVQRQGDHIEGAPTEQPAADVGVTGTAHDLVMWLWGRAPEDVSITGGQQRAAAWNLIVRADF